MHRAFALLFCATLLAACVTTATMTAPDRSSPTLRLHEGGVTPRSPTIEAGDRLRVVNDDVRAHEIYSSDCRELATTLLRPGQMYLAQLDAGPKICHFQDLLSPTAEEYWGTVSVGAPLVTDPVFGL